MDIGITIRQLYYLNLIPLQINVFKQINFYFMFDRSNERCMNNPQNVCDSHLDCFVNVSYSCQHNQGKWWHRLRKGLSLPKTLRIGDHHFLHRSLEDRKFQVYYLFPWEVYVEPFRPKRHIASRFQVGLVSVIAILYTHQSYNWGKNTE